MRRKAATVVLSVLLAFGISTGCSGAGCDTIEPLPNGNTLPSSQTIEGGIQVRITPGGFGKISAIIPGLVEGLGDVEVIGSSTGDFAGIIGYELCTDNPAGCVLDISVPAGGVNVYVENQQYLRLDIDILFNLPIDFHIDILGFGIFDCTLNIGTPDARTPVSVSVAVEPYIRDTDGHMRVRVTEINQFSFGGIQFNFDNCGFATSILNELAGYINDFISLVDSLLNNPITNFVLNLLLPFMDGLIDGLFPDPLGIEGQVDVGGLLADFAPGAEGAVELLIVPGGYVNLLGNGMSLGVISGTNSDSDPTTRSSTMVGGVAEHSEPHACMPRMPTIDLAALGMTQHGTRGTFVKGATDELSGLNDDQHLQYTDPNSPLFGTTADLALGVTEHFLDHFGFHLLNSGSLCLEIGTDTVDLLTVGLFSILVSSLGNLVDPEVGDAPMRMVIRPQTPADFTIGAGTPDDPLLDLGLRDFQIDVYAWTEERYALAFTMAMDMHIGINLASYVDTDGTVYLTPTLEGIDSQNVTVRILNSELIADQPSTLEQLLPSVMGMIVPMLTSALQDIALPEFSGITMEQLEFRSNNANDTMLILASLKLPPPVPPLPSPPLPVETEAQVVRVHVPTPEELRSSLTDPTVPKAQKDVPAIHLRLYSALLDLGHKVEWQYRLNNGIWRGFRQGENFVIKDETLYFQGWHFVEVRGRRVGYSESLERHPVGMWVLIDSMAPIMGAKVEAGTVYFNGFDVVSPRNALLYSYEFEPGNWSSWSPRGHIGVAHARNLAAAHGGVLRVRVQDEAGNISEHEVPGGILGVESTEKKGGCATGGTGGSPFGLLFIMLGLFGLRRFFRSGRGKEAALVAAGVIAGAALVLGSGCAKRPGGQNQDAGPSCSTDDECSALQCPAGEVPLCLFGTCQCTDDVPLGKVGPHSSLAVTSTEALVAAYNVRYGDLMLGRIDLTNVSQGRAIIDRWEFVDGVPWSLPPDVSTSDVRGGIMAAGDNVGRWTSIDTDFADYPFISYYSLTHGALKLARWDGAEWRMHIVDDGGDPEGPVAGDAGRYTRINLHPVDKSPGVAYFVQAIPSGDASKTVTQVRYAQAVNSAPSSSGEWDVYIIDELEVDIPADSAPLDDFPEGVGVTIGLDRTSDGRAVVAYHDSLNGNLKVAEFLNATDGFSAPVIIDGEDQNGQDTGNVGLYPSVKVDLQDDTLFHFTYMDYDRKELLYTTSDVGAVVELVDDGYTLQPNPTTGIDMPISHMVGWDSNVGLAGTRIFVAYQDSTGHQLKWADREGPDQWTVQTIIGDTDPVINTDGTLTYEGAYGFWIGMDISGGSAFLSSYAINEWATGDLMGNPPDIYYVEIFELQLGVQ